VDKICYVHPFTLLYCLLLCQSRVNGVSLICGEKLGKLRLGKEEGVSLCVCLIVYVIFLNAQINHQRFVLYGSKLTEVKFPNSRQFCL